MERSEDPKRTCAADTEMTVESSQVQQARQRSIAAARNGGRVRDRDSLYAHSDHAQSLRRTVRVRPDLLWAHVHWRDTAVQLQSTEDVHQCGDQKGFQCRHQWQIELPTPSCELQISDRPAMEFLESMETTRFLLDVSMPPAHSTSRCPALEPNTRSCT